VVEVVLALAPEDAVEPSDEDLRTLPEDGEQEAQRVGHGQEHGPMLLDAPRLQTTDINVNTIHYKSVKIKLI